MTRRSSFSGRQCPSFRRKRWQMRLLQRTHCAAGRLLDMLTCLEPRSAQTFVLKTHGIMTCATYISRPACLRSWVVVEALMEPHICGRHTRMRGVWNLVLWAEASSRVPCALLATHQCSSMTTLCRWRLAPDVPARARCTWCNCPPDQSGSLSLQIIQVLQRVQRAVLSSFHHFAIVQSHLHLTSSTKILEFGLLWRRCKGS